MQYVAIVCFVFEICSFFTWYCCYVLLIFQTLVRCIGITVVRVYDIFWVFMVS